MMRVKPGLALMMALMLTMLTACSPMPLVQSQQESQVVLPTPLPALAPVARVGDSQADEPVRVSLMFLNQDDTQLVPMSRTIWITEGTTLVEQVVKTLLEAPRAEGLKPIAPSGTRLLTASLVNRIATVNLSSEARNQDQQSMVSMQVAIANTLTGIAGIDHVNILIEGQVEGIGDQVASIPTGALQHNDNALSAIWLQTQSDENRASAPQTQLDRTAVLYFGAKDGDRLVPEARKVQFDASLVRKDPREMIMPLLQQLWAGPSALDEARGVFPEDMVTMKAVPTITTQTDGKRVINLLLWESFEADMEKAGLSLRQFYGALTLTLTQFVPEVDGLSVRVGNKRVMSVNSDGGETLSFANGVMAATDFRALVGDVSRVYLSNGEGQLVGCGRVLDPYAAHLPRTLIEQLIEGPKAGETGVEKVMPAGVSSADILGVRVEGELALINLSSNFYRCAQALDEVGERLMIYAVVNTLTDLSGIRKVRFYVEDEAVDTLSQKIYLRVELLRNPGLIENAALP